MARYWVTDNLSPRTSAGVEFADHYSNVHILLQEELSPVIWLLARPAGLTVSGVVGGGEGGEDNLENFVNFKSSCSKSLVSLDNTQYSLKREMTGACRGRHLVSYNATLTAEARMMLGFCSPQVPSPGRGPQSPVLSDTEPQAVRRLRHPAS